MLTEQRYEIILGLLREKKSVTVTELKDILNASESTVRRDITALYKAGKLTRVFGGAVALEHTVNDYEIIKTLFTLINRAITIKYNHIILYK